MQSLLRTALLDLEMIRQRISVDAWVSDQYDRGTKVDMYRDYVEGDHKADLTLEMKKLLRVGLTGGSSEFVDNYMDLVVQTMNDRLEVSAITGDNDAATGWLDETTKNNDFSSFQSDVHEAAIRDGDTFIMPYWDNATQQIRLSHEPAFDGREGMLVIYGESEIDVAIKVWVVDSDEQAQTNIVRINVYLPGEIRKYSSLKGGSLERIGTDDWTLNGEPLGIPVIHLRNRGKKHNKYGISEIDSATTLQDALNRTIYSMVMTSENTAFQRLVAIGFDPPDAVTPGGWITINAKDVNGKSLGLKAEDQVNAYAIEPGQIVPFIDQAKFFISQIGATTRTPAPEMIWSDASGEALQQREVGLIKKCERFQRQAAPAWRKVLLLAHRIQQAYGPTPPAMDDVMLRWKSPRLKSHTEIIDNALKIVDRIPYQTFLELIAPAYGWSAEKVQEITQLQQDNERANMAALGASLPAFSQTRSVQ